MLTAPRSSWLRRLVWWLRGGPDRLEAARLRRRGYLAAAVGVVLAGPGDDDVRRAVILALLARPDLPLGKALRRLSVAPPRLSWAWRWAR
jgi:hypothetical protein